MATYIQELHNKQTDDTIYPVTKANAVYRSDNTTTVEGTLGQVDTLFKKVQYTYTTTIAAGASLFISGNNLGITTPTGYTPIGFDALSSGDQTIFLSIIQPVNTGAQAVLRIKNMYTAALTPVISLSIVYARTEFISS